MGRAPILPEIDRQMSQARHTMLKGRPKPSFRLLGLVLSLILLGCGEGPQLGSQDAQASGAATVTAWAKQGTTFPELEGLATSTPAMPMTEVSANQPSASARPSPTALVASTLAPSETAGAATIATQVATPQPTTRRATLDSIAKGSQEPAGRITIPSLDIDAPVVEVSWHVDQVEGQAVAIWDTAAGAAGHHRGTAAPGAQGNCVISGHSRAQDGGVFNKLWLLEPGGLIKVTNVDGDQYTYVVDRVEKVEELGQPLVQRLANAALMAPTQEARLTLITCWPDWAYTHRVIVVARLQ